MKNTGYDHFFKAAKENSETVRSKKKRSNPVQKKKKKVRKKSKKSSLSLVGAFSSAGILAVAVVGLLCLEDFDGIFDVVEVSIFGQAVAAEESSPSKEVSGEKVADQKETAPKKTEAMTKEEKEEELSFLSKLRERKLELDQRENTLVELERELQEQKKAINKKIKELKKIRDEIALVLEDRIEYDDKRIEKLVEFYSNMKPQQAAQVFETIDEGLAVEVLGRMKKKNAANIMNLLKPDKTQNLSEKFAGYRQQGK